MPKGEFSHEGIFQEGMGKFIGRSNITRGGDKGWDIVKNNFGNTADARKGYELGVGEKFA